MNLIDLLSGPWHWSFSGLVIVTVMFLLLWMGGNFGASANFRTMCSIGGAGKHSEFFDFDWKSQVWNLVFIGSAIVGGYIATTWLANPDAIVISEGTVNHLSKMGVGAPIAGDGGSVFLPPEIFGPGSFTKLSNIILLIVGGFLVGFGARYAGGCTSGHAISGLSNLQLPSLIAVIGFFIGGLTMTWLILPYLFPTLNV